MKELYRGKKQNILRAAGSLALGSALMVSSDSLAIEREELSDYENDSKYTLIVPMYGFENHPPNIEIIKNRDLSLDQEKVSSEIELEEMKEYIFATPSSTITPTPPLSISTPASTVEAQSANSLPAFTQNSGKVMTNGESVWLVLADCESGDGQVGAPFYAQWDYNGPSGFDGGLQFHPDTWNRINTGYDYAWQAPLEVQVAAAKVWLSKTSWGQWPSCKNEMIAAGYTEQMITKGKLE